MSGSRRIRKQDEVETKGTRFKVDQTMVLLAGIMLLGLAIRLIPALYTIVGGQVIFNGPDSSYHMRRIVDTIVHYPFPNLYDSYVNYPDGFPITWPPIFDIMMATASLILGLGHPDTLTIEVVSSFVPVLIGIVTIPVIYYLAKEFMDEKVALIAAFLFAVIPAGVFRSMFGVVDHHGLEVLVSMGMYLLFVRSVTSSKKEGMSLSSPRHTRPLLYAVLAGAVMACMVLSWDGASIFIGVVAIYAFIQYAYDLRNGESSGYLTLPGVIAAATGLAAILAVDALGAVGYRLMTSHMAGFETIFLLCLLVFFGLMELFSSALQKRGLPWYALPAVTVLLAVVGAVIVWVVHPGFLYDVRSGLLYLTGMDQVTNTVSETEMLFISGGKLSFTVPWAYFSLIGPISILGLLLYLLTIYGRKLSQAEVYLLAWTAAAIVLGIMQKRFMNILAVSVSLFAGYAFYKALEMAGLEEYLHPAKAKKPSASRAGSMSTALVAVTGVAVLLLLPAFLSSIAMAFSPEYYALDWNNACQWVSDNTPKTSFLYSPDNGTHPEYGIMSWWDYGNYILYRGERPAVANNFQTGVNQSALFFTAPNETAADLIMDNRSARYVMLDQRMGSLYAGTPYGIFEDMALLAGENASSYHYKTVPLNRSADQKYYDTMYSRLFYFDGCGGNVSSYTAAPLDHYRLVFETHGTDPVKVFQYVKGALITGKADPGSDVSVRLKVSTPYEAQYYTNSTTAGPDGEYAFIVPYATSTADFVTTDPAYTVTAGARTASVPVAENDITGGNAITV